MTCRSATECVAAGGLGASQVLLETGSGLSWTPASPALPAGTGSYPEPQLNSVTCPSTSECVAVGGYVDASSNYLGLLVSGSGSSWTAVEAPLPAGAPVSQGDPGTRLLSVACPTASACVAVGTYTDTSGDGQVLLETGSGSSWAAAEGPRPSNDVPEPSGEEGAAGPPSASPVVCASASSCVAVGRYTATPGQTDGLLLAGPS